MSQERDAQRTSWPLLVIALLLVGAIALKLALPSLFSQGRDHVQCPAVRSYSPAFLKALAREMKSLPSDSALFIAIGDYEIMRDEARKCAAPEFRHESPR